MVLATLLVGVPMALVRLGGPLLPVDPGWGALVRALTRPDDGSIVLALITVVGWLAWAVFALSVLTELVRVISRSRIRIRLPGLAGPQRVAAGLILAVLALSAAPAVSGAVPLAPAAQAETIHPSRAPVRPGAAPARAMRTVTAPAPTEPTRTHMVEPGDDLWSLAQHYYGDGQQWRLIARANPDLLTGGPDRLTVGWRLSVPELHSPADADGTGGSARTVTVRPGETLSEIADRELGSTDRWPEIYHANRAQLDDPDELVAGIRLALPAAKATTPVAPSRGGDTRGPAPAPVRPKSDPAPTPPSPRTAPPTTAPATVPPTTAPPTAEPEATAAAPAAPAPVEEHVTAADAVLPLAGIGGLLAAGLVAGLLRRRGLQLQARPVGRRIVHPPASTQRLEVALGRRQRPLTLRTLDQALRAIGAHCRAQQLPLPALRLVLVGEEQIELVMAEADGPAPVPFRVEGRSWRLDAGDAGYLRSVPGADEALRPWPSLVTLGRDARDRQVLVDLEGLGLLQLEAENEAAAGVLAALTVDLSFSPWAEEIIVTTVGGSDRLPAALGRHDVTHTSDVDHLLARLERRAAEQRRHQPHPVLGQHRLDPDLADPWTPEVVLVHDPVTADQRRRLQQVVLDEPRVTIAAVVVGHDAGAPWTLRWEAGARGAVLLPDDLPLRPARLEPDEAEAVLQLVEGTGRTDTTPAPWWAGQVVEPERPPDNVTYLGSRFGEETATTEDGGEVAAQAARRIDGADAVDHPTLLLLGPVELLGATGPLPPRAAKQCLEYCAWLLEHPGRTAQGMAAALAVAEGTRRSNMSRLRSWLGEGGDGRAYLPDAYTGRIALHPSVSSDWQRLQILTATGVDRAGDDALRAALQLVRGAPLADAAPGQWHWAEELRTDMISCVRDVGVELTRRALDQGDLDLARWAAARALVAAPGDEQLLTARIRTEHLAGNPAETERLTLQLAAQARRLGVDLDEQTVVLLQEVVEGRVRARLA
ncbi:LysM peptidoglycan-binding domain-containing protein [uncultured Friedmanniella sp.]|uniref:LysM peptidoglycan-binding domain-containing protein n=1 Tax=uncultured Friedmanniella sp. TaxID=335381 RepID=UPI0035CABC50